MDKHKIFLRKFREVKNIAGLKGLTIEGDKYYDNCSFDITKKKNPKTQIEPYLTPNQKCKLIFGERYFQRLNKKINPAIKRSRKVIKSFGIKGVVPVEVLVFLHELGHFLHYRTDHKDFVYSAKHYFEIRELLSQTQYSLLPMEVKANENGALFLLKHLRLINRVFNIKLEVKD